MSNKDRPIKVVDTVPEDFSDKSYNFGAKEPIREVTNALKRRLKAEVAQVSEYFSGAFKRWPGVPAVAKVTLYEKALAKSHRPSSLLGDNTCPVIGSGTFGELLISVTQKGLEQLSKKIENSTNFHNGTLHIAVIDKIEPYTFENDITIENSSDAFLLKLFDHKDRNANKVIDNKFLEFIKELGIEKPKKYEVTQDVSFYEIKSNKSIFKLAGFVGIRKLEPMPTFTLDHSLQGAVNKNGINIHDFPKPIEDVHYPLLGIIDGGVDKNNASLRPWIWDSLDLIEEEEHDFSHGNMVASLAINGRWLNNSSPGFPESQAEIVDVAAFPKNRALKLTELMKAIRLAVNTYPEVKVWNLSLGCSTPCKEDAFSELGHFLNGLHDENECLFVVASGNYLEDPQRSWPPQELNGNDRISAPADSVRALTVGSVAHLESSASMVKRFEPSSFSRRGPGPACIPKPEITHFGGNCDCDLDSLTVGVRGLGEDGSLVESIGTSFSTPLVSSLAASLWHQLEVNGKISPSPERIKALLIHSALRNTMHSKEKGIINYHGFGKPSDSLDEILGCNKNEITFLFEVDTREGIEFSRTPFVIPKSLRTADNKFVGEILMTLVYSPPLDFDFPSEYCRSNVDVSFGTYTYDSKKGKMVHSGKVPQIKDKSEMYEKSLIENGFKWSPVKVYRNQFPQGIVGDDWRLKLDVQRRAEQEPLSTPQRAALAITLRSLNGSESVYTEAVKEMEKLGWQEADIILVEQPQVRVR